MPAVAFLMAVDDDVVVPCHLDLLIAEMFANPFLSVSFPSGRFP